MEIPLKEIAKKVGGKIKGEEEIIIKGVAPIKDAVQGEISFIANKKYIPFLKDTKASAVIVSEDVEEAGITLLQTKDPYLAFAKTLSLFAPKHSHPKGISPKSFVSESAQIGKDVSIYPNVYIGERTKVGDRTIIYPGVYIGSDVVIGKDSLIYPNVTIYHGSILGDRVIVHGGVVIGSDGFGFAPTKEGREKIPQIGIVEIGDDVEIGSNTTIDRATMGATKIGKGVKIDNLVQIAHNVVIGENSVIVAQVGIAGSVTVGKNVILAGQVGVAGHIEIGDNVMVGPKSGVAKSIKAGSIVIGSPPIPRTQYIKSALIFAQLPEIKKMVENLSNELEKLKKELKKS